MNASENIETKTMKRDIAKVRTHDAIVGLLYLISVGLAWQFGMQWLLIAVGVGFLSYVFISSEFPFQADL